MHVLIKIFYLNLSWAYWHIIGKLNNNIFNMYNMIWYTYMLLKYFTHELNNTSIILHTYHFVCFGWEHLNSTLSKFQLYHTIISAIVVMLYNRSSGLIPLITESSYSINNLYFSQPQATSNHCSILRFWVQLKFIFLTYKWYSTIFTFPIWFISLSIVTFSFNHVVTNDTISFFLKAK